MSVASYPPTYRNITENRKSNVLLFSFQNNFSSRYRHAYWGRDGCPSHIFVMVNTFSTKSHIVCSMTPQWRGCVHIASVVKLLIHQLLRTCLTRLLAREHGNSGNLHAHDGLCDWPLCVYYFVSDDNWPIHGFSTCVPRHTWLNISFLVFYCCLIGLFAVSLLNVCCLVMFIVSCICFESCHF
jgi:hypothetical protein